MSKEQVLDKGIRQKSTKRVNSFIVCSAFGPGPPNRDPIDSEKQLRVYTSGRTMARHVWRVDQAPGHTCRNQNACLKVRRLSMGNIFAGTYSIQCELVNIFLNNFRNLNCSIKITKILVMISFRIYYTEQQKKHRDF